MVDGKAPMSTTTGEADESGCDEDLADREEESDDLLVDEATAEGHHMAYVAYQAAKDRYREALKGRGTDPEEMKRRSEEKLRQAKARSYCAACKRRGHWQKDPECPLRGKTGASTSKEPAGGHGGGGLHQAQFCCNRVYLTYQAQDVDLRYKSDEHPIRDSVEEILSNGGLQLVYMAGGNETGLWTRGGNPAKMQAIVDTACTRTVAGYEWFESYCALMDFYDVEVVVRDGYDSFKFGASRLHVSRFSVDAWFSIEGACLMVNVAVVPCRVPLLFSRPVLSGLGMRYDLAAHKVDLPNLGIHNLAMTVGTTGHPVLEVSRFPAEGPPRSPLKDFDDVGIPVARAYMTEVADLPLEASPKLPEPEIFYPKKIAPEAYNLLTGKWDRGGHGFLAWWQGANQCRDFWIETGQEMIRIHVVPRKRAFDPKLWTTKYGHLKDQLLRRLGPVRETEAVPCLAAGTLVEKQSCLWSEESEREGLQHEARCLQRLGLWVGRSRFMKLEAAVTTVSGPSIRNVDADPGSLQPSEVTMEDGQGRDLDRARGVPSGGTREVDRPRIEGDPDRAKDRARADTFDKYGSHYGVDEDDLGSAGDGGYLARPDVAGEADPGAHDEASPGCHQHSGRDGGAFRPVQGVVLQGSTRRVPSVGHPGDQGWEQPPRPCETGDLGERTEAEGGRAAEEDDHRVRRPRGDGQAPASEGHGEHGAAGRLQQLGWFLGASAKAALKRVSPRKGVRGASGEHGTGHSRPRQGGNGRVGDAVGDTAAEARRGPEVRLR